MLIIILAHFLLKDLGSLWPYRLEELKPGEALFVRLKVSWTNMRLVFVEEGVYCHSGL